MAHPTENHQLTEEMKTCIENCLKCHALCIATTIHCLRLGGHHASPRHIALLMDCAEICQTSANFMLRHSRFHAQTCGICADVCESCAADCENLADGDKQMLSCAEMCYQCADTCRQMSAEGQAA
jgi:hypothetical protein